MLLEVIESMKELINTNYSSLYNSNLATQGGLMQSQDYVDARKEGIFYGKIISSHVIVGRTHMFAIEPEIRSFLQKLSLQCLLWSHGNWSKMIFFWTNTFSIN